MQPNQLILVFQAWRVVGQERGEGHSPDQARRRPQELGEQGPEQGVDRRHQGKSCPGEFRIQTVSGMKDSGLK